MIIAKIYYMVQDMLWESKHSLCPSLAIFGVQMRQAKIRESSGLIEKYYSLV
jgi:hypothetical protein